MQPNILYGRPHRVTNPYQATVRIVGGFRAKSKALRSRVLSRCDPSRQCKQSFHFFLYIPPFEATGVRC